MQRPEASLARLVRRSRHFDEAVVEGQRMSGWLSFSRVRHFDDGRWKLIRGCSHITSAKTRGYWTPLPPPSAMVSICHTSGLEQQIRPFSGLFLDNGPDRDKVRKLGLLRKHCFNIYRSLSACINWGNFFMNKSFQSPHINVACFCEEGVSSEGGGFNTGWFI